MCNYRKDYLTTAGTKPGLDQNMQMQPYSQPTTETYTVTASYAVGQSSL